MGAIYKNTKYYKDEAFQFLLDNHSNKKVFESFLRTLIGKCIVVIKSSLEIRIYVSPSSSGLFYMKSKNKSTLNGHNLRLIGVICLLFVYT